MNLKKLSALLLCSLMLLSSALAEGLTPLPMDDLSFGAEPKKENFIVNPESRVKGQEYLSHIGYEDESISVKVYKDRYADTDYIYAHVKISHPSQLRTAPASMANTKNKRPSFKDKSTGRGRLVAGAVNAVISLNGDYYTKDECTVVLRMGTQVRNRADGTRDLLVIDKNGDFSYLTAPKKEDYATYYEANKDKLYQVFCFGPVLAENGVSVISEDFLNKSIGSQKGTQRSAICQLGELEYMLITCYGPQSKNNKGMTIYEFAQVCEQAGRKLNPETGCKLAFNLDGGNSSTINFKQDVLEKKELKWKYVKINCPEIERFLSDIIYFATLVK